jgi:hypothetical protein
VLIANDISDMGALSVLNLASNSLGELVLPEGWTSGPNAGFSAMEYMHTNGRKQNQHPGKPEGIIAVANAIKDMRALTALDISKNRLGGFYLGYSRRSPSGYGSFTATPEGLNAIADAIKDNGTLKTLDISNNDIGQLGLPEGWSTDYISSYTGDDKYKHTDGRKQATAPEGSRIRAESIIALASAISDMGALATVIMHKYPLPIEDIKTKAELDLSGKGLVDLDAIVLAALLPLNVSR